MRGWPRSITLRLSAAFALLATLVFALLGLYFSRASDAHMAELDAHHLHGKLALVGHIAGQTKRPEEFAQRLNDALAGEHGLLLAVDSENGAIFRWPAGPVADALAQTGIDHGVSPQVVTLDENRYRALSARVESDGYGPLHIVAASDIRHHTEFLDQLTGHFRIAIGFAALLTALVGALIVRRGLLPLRHITHAAGRISAGQLAERIPVDQVPDELQALVDAFNAMLGRLEDAFRRLSEFSADLAHELRTPIHSLRMQTEVTLAKARDIDAYRDLLASHLEAYERLSRIIADMLLLAKADHGLLVPQREPVALRALCERLVDYYGLLDERLSICIDGPEIELNGDRLMLERAIGNLLLNAIQHTPASGEVRLVLAAQGNATLLSVINSGPAIPPEALERIFERFVRIDPNSAGNGLGLAIARSIVLAHGGKILIDSKEGRTEFRILFEAQ